MRHICLRSARPSQTARSASSASRFPWVTEKTRQDWYLPPRKDSGIATSLIDLGNRFRLIINDVDCKKTEKPMPKLPVATNFWTPQPDLYTGAEAWILAGGAHHTAFTYDLTAEQMGDWANAMGIEAVYIDKDTKIREFKRGSDAWQSVLPLKNNKSIRGCQNGIPR